MTINFTDNPFDPSLDYIVCVTVRDMPKPRTPGADIEDCASCGEHIWVAPSSPQHRPKICLDCAIAISAAEGAEK